MTFHSRLRPQIHSSETLLEPHAGYRVRAGQCGEAARAEMRGGGESWERAVCEDVSGPWWRQPCRGAEALHRARAEGRFCGPLVSGFN